jgi:hypothetical protein
MPLGKAPGPDEFTTNLFHLCWSMIREEVWKLVEEYRTSGQVPLLLSMQPSSLSFQRKNESLTRSNSQPIALCNVIYKIITKFIALRLKPILPFIISKENSRYVEGRQILDSVILVHEVIHSIKTTRTPGMLIRLDLSKYFDCLSWNYMRSLLSAFGFSQDWICWISNITSFAFYLFWSMEYPHNPSLPPEAFIKGTLFPPFSLSLWKKAWGLYQSFYRGWISPRSTST